MDSAIFPPQLNLDPVFGIGTLPDHHIFIWKKRECTVELKQIHPLKNIMVKIAAKIAALVDTKFKLITDLHADRTLAADFNDLADHSIADWGITHCHDNTSFKLVNIDYQSSVNRYNKRDVNVNKNNHIFQVETPYSLYLLKYFILPLSFLIPISELLLTAGESLLELYRKIK